MSGPIVRKYGFPNFEKIFGSRPLQHGTEDEPSPPPDDPPRDRDAGETPKPEDEEDRATKTDVSPPTEFGLPAE